ncbi:hypothetical protein MRX96_035074 [Rhipicephalus microplus]
MSSDVSLSSGGGVMASRKEHTPAAVHFMDPSHHRIRAALLCNVSLCISHAHRRMDGRQRSFQAGVCALGVVVQRL